VSVPINVGVRVTSHKVQANRIIVVDRNRKSEKEGQASEAWGLPLDFAW